MPRPTRHIRPDGSEIELSQLADGTHIANVRFLRKFEMQTICSEVNRTKGDNERIIAMDVDDPNVVV